LFHQKNIVLVILFAIAMAYLESAVVVYLRGMYGIVDLVRDTNFIVDVYTYIEIGREAATIVMLLIVGLIAGKTLPQKISYSIFAFGIWDIFYYFWLYVFIQWPKSLFEWDILFLIPLPWWGPVITPILISILLIVVSYIIIIEIDFKVTPLDWVLFLIAILIILFTFMEDSVKILVTGNGNLAEVKPTSFNWPVFIFAYTVMILISIKIFYTKRKKIIT
jgi:hypothetical protein